MGLEYISYYTNDTTINTVPRALLISSTSRIKSSFKDPLKIFLFFQQLKYIVRESFKLKSYRHLEAVGVPRFHLH